MHPLRKPFALAVLCLAISAGFFLFFATRDRPAVVNHATILPEPMSLPEFSLTDQDGNTFTRDDLLGAWHLVFFGFTNCPDICPATLQQLSIAGNRVAEGGAGFPAIILISVDPARDTPIALRAYTAHFGRHVTGVTGDPDELRKLTNALGIYFAVSGERNGNYSVDHSAAVLLLNDKAQWSAVFSAPHSIDAFVHDVPILTGAL